MKKRRILIFIIITVFVQIACHTRKPDIFSVDQESANLKLLKDNKFEFSYFRMGGMNFENSEKTFCQGIYDKLSDGEYELHPKKFNPDSIEPKVNLSDFNSNSSSVHLIINTEFKDKNETGFELVVHSDSTAIRFHKLDVDTVLSDFPKSSIKIEILLPDFYINGHPPAIYKKLLTSDINVQNAKSIIIDIPVSKDYFYYKRSGNIRIQDDGKYYLINNKKIKKGQ